MDIIYKFSYVFLLFFIYSVIGYLCEIIYCFIGNGGKFENRGFLTGPYCPIYGFGALIIIFLLEKYKSQPLTLFFISMFLTSSLEYFTSYLMEKIFENKWWDYSNRRFNINGRVCLLNSFLFGIGGLILIYYINPFITKYVTIIPTKWQFIVSVILFILIIFDTIKSSNTAFNLKAKLRSIKEDIGEYLEEERIKISQINVENLNNLTNLMEYKISKILEGNKGKKLNKLIKKLPDVSKLKNVKVDAISIIKNHISNKKDN